MGCRNLDGGAVAPALKIAILIFPHFGDCFSNPYACHDQDDGDGKRQEIHLHAVFVVVRVLAALIFAEIFGGSVGSSSAITTPQADGLRSGYLSSVSRARRHWVTRCRRFNPVAREFQNEQTNG